MKRVLLGSTLGLVVTAIAVPRLMPVSYAKTTGEASSAASRSEPVCRLAEVRRLPSELLRQLERQRP